MSDQLIVQRRRKRAGSAASRRIAEAFTIPVGGAAPAIAGDCPISFREPEEGHRTIISGSISATIHFGALGLLLLIASLAPNLDENLIPVHLLKEQPEPEPAPAPKFLAERRSLDYAPALQAVRPQIVNPHIIAAAAPRVRAEAIQMDAVTSVAAPTQINRATTVVERVSALNSPFVARASKVDVSNLGGPVVRGPVRVNAPVGPSVGPRAVTTTAGGTSSGTGSLQIGGGSSVREGLLSGRDVVGSPDGVRVANVDTTVGEGFLRGSGGTGTSLATPGTCFGRPAVVSYLGTVESRTLERWNLPPGVNPDQKVTLKFRIDVAGSATKVSLVRADDNALGVSAIDALRSASPFPPIPDAARCLASTSITATFSNPGAG